MSMLRSLDSAVSGLRNHQVRMDIIGNNIANINTVGFKSSRLTFEESLSQLLQGSTRPPGESGGTNPIQVGLGMSVGSIDTKFTQGNLEATGQVTDLAIEGSSFFAVSNGEADFYTRNGAFQLDSKGNLVLPTNGFILQGKMASSEGTFPPGTVVEDITIPLAEQSPAHSTENVIFGKNLDSDSMATGSVDYSQVFQHNAEGEDLLTAIRNSNGELLGIEMGDTLTFSATHPITGSTVASSYMVSETSTLDDLRAAMQSFLRDPIAGLGIATANVDMMSYADDVASSPPGSSRGAMSIWGNILPGGSGNIQGFQVSSNSVLSRGNVEKAFSVPSTIPNGAARGEYITDNLRAPARADDEVVQIYDQNGNPTGLENGDEIHIQGEIGNEPANNLPGPIIYSDGSGGGAATTMADLLQAINDNFKLPATDGTIADNPSVSINAGGSDDNIPDGAIVVRGIAGRTFQLNNISVRAVDINSLKPSPTDFNANFNFEPLQVARDPQVADTSITVFDESGDDHLMTMTFIPTNTPGHWQWRINMAGSEIPIGGTQGDLIFDQDGTVSSFSYGDGATGFSFDPNNGSSIVRVRLDVGGPGDFRGLTQFRAPTTAAITGQDGFTTGSLREISIGEDGLVSGIFTNGVKKSLAQVMLVDFINPGGLMKVSDSVFSRSGNSGDPVFVEAGNDRISKIKPGALEISNVELALEFTEMITTQRGYQANARGVTISDSLLEELVNLKR